MMRCWSKALLTKVTGLYQRGELIFESSTPGTYEIELLTIGTYEIYCIAGGSGANYSKGTLGSKFVGSGGSGSGFIGVLKLTDPVLSIVVGNGGFGTSHDSSTTTSGAGGNSSISNIVVCYGASGATIGRDHAIYGKGGSLPTLSAVPITTILHSVGNDGNYSRTSNSTTYGGAALYENYGKGGDNVGTSPQNGSAGYVKIVYLGK